MLSIVWEGDWSITQPWGVTTLAVEPLWDSPLGTVHWHCGVDVGMPVWTPLFAARGGRVSYTGYGLLAIEVGVGMHDWYVHIESAQVALGATVQRGAFVAYSGAKVPSGGSLTGPHLHFEVQTGALNVPTGLDPVPALEGVFGATSGNLKGGFLMALTDAEQAEALNKIRIIHQGLFGSDSSVLPTALQDHVKAIHDRVDLAHQALFGGDAVVLTPPIQDAVAQLLAKTSGGSAFDPTPILAAIADLKVHPAVLSDPVLLGKVTAIEAHLNAPRPPA